MNQTKKPKLITEDDDVVVKFKAVTPGIQHITSTSVSRSEVRSVQDVLLTNNERVLGSTFRFRSILQSRSNSDSAR